MELTMLENGLDFIINSIEHLKEAEVENCESKEHQIKYSLLHLSSGIELILKSRLYIEHWTYIFSDMNKASKKKLDDGSFRSVESSTLIDRLERLCNINVEKNSKEAFENLRKLRNQMEHFTVKDNFPAIESCINNALSAINKFIVKNYTDFKYPMIIDLNDDDSESGLTKKENQLIDKLIKSTAELKEHYDDALKIAEAKAKNESILEELVKCPSCKEQFLRCNYNNTNICHCFFCGYEKNGEKTANEFINIVQGVSEYEIVKEGGEYPLYDCPDCGVRSMVKIDGMYKCFSCGMYYDDNEAGFCEECGELYIKHDSDIGICDSCIKNKLEK